MADIGSPQKTGTPSEIAVEYLLRRITSDPRLAWSFSYTESLKLITKAYALANGQDPGAFHKQCQRSLRTEDPAPGHREMIYALQDIQGATSNGPRRPDEGVTVYLTSRQLALVDEALAKAEGRS